MCCTRCQSLHLPLLLFLFCGAVYLIRPWDHFRVIPSELARDLTQDLTQVVALSSSHSWLSDLRNAQIPWRISAKFHVSLTL